MPATAYLDLSAARTLAATLPPAMLVNFIAGSDSACAAALLVASDDIDQAMRYQGRKFTFVASPTPTPTPTQQLREFPRLAYEQAAVPGEFQGGDFLGNQDSDYWVQPDGSIPLPNTVWDWDPVNNIPVVPQNVLTATLYQADWILGGGDSRLDDQHAGVKGQSAAGVGDTYGDAPGTETGLCRRAYKLLRRYRLAVGRLR